MSELSDKTRVSLLLPAEIEALQYLEENRNKIASLLNKKPEEVTVDDIIPARQLDEQQRAYLTQQGSYSIGPASTTVGPYNSESDRALRRAVDEGKEQDQKLINDYYSDRGGMCLAKRLPFTGALTSAAVQDALRREGRNGEAAIVGGLGVLQGVGDVVGFGTAPLSTALAYTGGNVGEAVAPEDHKVLGTLAGALLEDFTPTLTKAVPTLVSKVSPTYGYYRAFNQNLNSIPLETTTLQPKQITVVPTPDIPIFDFYANLPATSKISEAERLGIPKIERNQPFNPSIQEGFNAQVSDIPVGFQQVRNLNNYLHKESLGLDNPQYISDLKSYISSLRNTGVGVDELTINDYRQYLNNLGISSRSLSNEEIAKLLQDQYTQLVKNQTGQLKGTIMYHGSPIMFDQFDLTQAGSYTGNMGAMGPGNYFSTGRNPYGLIHLDNGRTLGNMQPYLITNVSSTPNRMILLDKNLIPKYQSPPMSQRLNDLQSQLARTNDINTKNMLKNQISEIINSPEYQQYYQNNIQPWINDWKLDPNAFILDESVFPHRTLNPIGKEGSPAPSLEGMLHRNSGIKSLFPHPSTLQQSESGNWFINRNWGDLRINYKNGGKLKKYQFPAGPIIPESDVYEYINPDLKQKKIQELINIEDTITKEGKQILTTLWDVLKVVDPTGLSSWPDVYKEIHESLKDGSISIQEAAAIGWQIIGALPMVGKVTAPAKIGKLAERVMTNSPKLANAVAKYINKGNKVLDTVPELFPGVKKLGAMTQDFTSKYFINPLFNQSLYMSNGPVSKLGAVRRAYGLNFMANSLNMLNSLQDLQDLALDVTNN